jgi:putative redox protein
MAGNSTPCPEEISAVNANAEFIEQARVSDSGPGSLVARITTAGVSFDGDEPVAAGGTGTGPDPYDLLCAALAECTALTVRLYADRKGWPLAAIEVGVAHEARPRATPRDLFRRRLHLAGALDPSQRDRLLEIAERCPVHRTLTNGSLIETEAV